MTSEPNAHVAFHLTGRRPKAGLGSIEGLDAQPALFARYRDLTTLRYDFPLVLVRGGVGAAGFVRSLSELIEDARGEVGPGDDAQRVTKKLLRLEQEIRVIVANGGRGPLSELWTLATGRLCAADETGAANRALYDRAWAALALSGEVADCDASLPALLFTHAWKAVQEERTNRLRADVRRLAHRLADILWSDAAHSAHGVSAVELRASVAPAEDEAIDFEAMARVLQAVAPRSTLSDSRRHRIRSLIAVLRSFEFAPDDHVFDSCASALAAHRARRPAVIELARAMAMAELEIEGEYREATHDPLFAEFGGRGLPLEAETLARFPDDLVCVDADLLTAEEQATLMEVLSAGLPVKVLLQTDDILDRSTLGDGHIGLGMRSRQIANAAIGLGDVYVLQTSGSHLVRNRDQIRAGLTHRGPALFSVFSGGTGQGGALPAYLVAAAAVESRAFPIFAFDPSAGPDWASRFRLDGNPQVERDWPIHTLTYEEEGHERVAVEVAFTLVDFVASDPRYARHFAVVPRAEWSASMVPVAETMAVPPSAPAGVEPGASLPTALLVAGGRTLTKAIVDGRLVREGRRCRELWHSLQELGGVHNSHAERRLALERESLEREARREPPAAASAAIPTAVAAAPPVAPGASVVVAEAAPEPASDEPFIETPRCTTCNECTQINAKMFAYNENKQAYIANPDAGTYAQLVQAAESCQVSIIHPGKPRNPSEPGLDELIQRAESFR